MDKCGRAYHRWRIEYLDVATLLRRSVVGIKSSIDIAKAPQHEWQLASAWRSSFGCHRIGRIAIGALAIGRLAIGRARIQRLEIDELNVRHLGVSETFQTPTSAWPAKLDRHVYNLRFGYHHGPTL